MISLLRGMIRGLALLVISAACLADTVTMAFGENRPPYIFDSAERGLEIDVVREALAYRGHRLKVVHLPNARLKSLEDLADTRLDAVAGVRHALAGSHRSAPYITFDNYAISKADRNLAIDSVQALKGYRVVAWQNAVYDLGDAYQQLFSADYGEGGGSYYEHHDQRKQVEMFWRDRVDVIIVDRYVFEWQSQRLASELNTGDAVTYHDIFPGETPFYVVFRDPRLRDDFDAGLQWLREEGRYQALVRAYLE